MKIAILTPTYYPYSGIDQVVAQQAKEKKTTIFTLAGKSDKDVVIMGMPKKLFWQRVYRLFFFFDFLKIFKYLKRLKEFDVIYSHFYPMNILALLTKIFYKKRYIYYNHGLPPADLFPNLVERIYLIFFKFLTNFTAKYADEIISVSQYLSDIFQRETGRKSSVEYNKINKKRFYHQANAKVIRDQYDLNNSPLILYVGRVSPHKGVHLLIEAFNYLLSSFPAAKLMIVGEHTFDVYSQKLRKKSGPSVIFTGFIPDEELNQYYTACDIYASASLWEGFNLPIIEAQFFKKPVVAFNIGPHKELIDHHGIVVPKGDTRAFAQALEKLLKNE